METGITIVVQWGMMQVIATKERVTPKTLSAALKYHTNSVKANELRRIVIMKYKGELIGCSKTKKIELYKKLGIEVEQHKVKKKPGKKHHAQAQGKVKKESDKKRLTANGNSEVIKEKQA
ncbi:hypothetical protein EZS27_010030 [termite gut metagenome]|uniref:Uncharacterized protein n=1 Tax=termite gut metagenome TaxID=433724 RepID=A0A5J4S7R8_9ZZZZ